MPNSLFMNASVGGGSAEIAGQTARARQDGSEQEEREEGIEWKGSAGVQREYYCTDEIGRCFIS